MLIRVLEAIDAVDAPSARASVEYKLNLLLSEERIKAEKAEIMFDAAYRLALEAGCVRGYSERRQQQAEG